MLKKLTRSLIIPALILILTATVIPSTVSASTEEIEDPSVKVTITDNEDSSTEVYPDMGIHQFVRIQQFNHMEQQSHQSLEHKNKREVQFQWFSKWR